MKKRYLLSAMGILRLVWLVSLAKLFIHDSIRLEINLTKCIYSAPFFKSEFSPGVSLVRAWLS